ncbi:MAG: hypothetical protein JST80_09720 [Bdellovibrionales bacterium]|nr:hypothetical protein [Bdellovibrionales bacterium]
MSEARLLPLFFIALFNPVAHAGTVSVGDAYDAFNQFMVTVRVFDAFEKRDGTYSNAGGAVNNSASGFAALIMSEAWAVPGKDDTKCLLAGYYGVVKGTRCVPDSGMKMFDDKGNIICSPTTFGVGIVISRPRDSRWTMACATEVIRKAGIAGKTAESIFSADEIKKLGEFLRLKQGVSFANNMYNSILTDCEFLNPKSQDAKDCDRVSDIVADALMAYVPAEPAGTNTSANKTPAAKGADKRFEDCWKEWTKKGAKLRVNAEVSMRSKFDALSNIKGKVNIKALSGCRLKAIDESAWKNDGINPDACKMSVGSDATFESYTPATASDLHAYFVLNGSVDCAKADKSTIKKTGKLRIDCSTAGTTKPQVVYRILRVFERHFDLNPACAYVLKKDQRGNDVTAAEESGKKAR